jgi:ParB-like chromosome segregation protein Spo0J
VSELEPSSPGSLHDAARSRDGELAAIIGERTEREGLPRNYRMRADAHYVEQLDRTPLGPVVRLIAARLIDGGDVSSGASLSQLSQSIAAHGILQPLLVRRAGGRYQLIAGRKRLAAAVGSGLSEVPCIVHEISESAAQTLIEAERARPAAADPIEARREPSPALLSALSHDLARIGSLADVLELASNPFQHRAAADFLKAEAWRAAWLVSAAAIVANVQPVARVVSVPRALDRVRAGFEPEARLARLQLDFTSTPDVAEAQCDEHFGTVVSGLLFATLGWMEGSDAARIDIRVDAPSPQSLRTQIVQRAAPPPPHATEGSDGPATHLTESIAFSAARGFSAARNGSVSVSPAGPRGAVIQLVFNRGPQA